MSTPRPGVPAPSLKGRMAEAPFRERGEVRYLELRARSLLNRCVSDRMPFEWTVNPYRGCAMGCRYCYATYTHEYMGITTPESFHSTVYVKTGAEAETARQLPSVVRRGQLVALGTATDPYQPGEAELGVTRRFLETASQVRGLRLGITTKGAAILRDIDVLQRIHARSSLSIHVSLISLDEALIRRLEPLAPPPAVRIEVLRRLVEAGLDVGLSLAPILPGITDAEADLDALLGAAAAAGVPTVSCVILFLRSPTKEKYLRWLEAEFPRLVDSYRDAYDGHVYLRGGYRRRIEEIVRRLRDKHGLAPSFSRGDRASPPLQLSFWNPPSS
jgi:DNA repair photolyase